MIDLHTHILPGIDDGAQNADTSLRMLRMEREQGVETVALTPHFYYDRESIDSFLSRRRVASERLEDAISRLSGDEQKALPRRILGAEVAWAPYMDRWERLGELCYEGSGYLLLEPPFSVWNGDMFRRLYELMERTGVTPVIAHIDRYFLQIDRRSIEELLTMGLPVQISAAAFTHFRTRCMALRALQQGKVQMLISDAHGDTQRAPDIGSALNVIRRRDRALYDTLTAFDLLGQG